MKIIEALKELPLLDKRIEKKISQIAEYAAFVDNGHEELPFKTEAAQKGEVDSLVQSCHDLVARSAQIRRQLAVTNTSVEVEIGGEKRTIAEWIYYREAGMGARSRAVQSLSDARAKNAIQRTQFDPEAGLKIVKFYDEKARNGEIERLTDIAGQIDARLEMINATTDLIE